MDSNERHPRAWRAFQAGLAVAALAAFWGSTGAGGCGSCEGLAATFLGGKHLSTLGTLYYGLLLGAAIVVGPHPAVFSGALIAAGVHAQLLLVLVQSKALCWPCLVAAGGAGTALVSAIILDPSNAVRGSLLLPATAVAIHAWLLVSGGLPAPRLPEDVAPEAVREELAVPPVEPGRARMVVYTREDCGYCMELERDVLPGLVREFGARLEVERRSAQDLPGIPTPTIILSGGGRKRLFPGLPPAADLRAVIETMTGDSHDLQTVLEKSR